MQSDDVTPAFHIRAQPHSTVNNAEFDLPIHPVMMTMI